MNMPGWLVNAVCVFVVLSIAWSGYLTNRVVQLGCALAEAHAENDNLAHAAPQYRTVTGTFGLVVTQGDTLIARMYDAGQARWLRLGYIVPRE